MPTLVGLTELIIDTSPFKYESESDQQLSSYMQFSYPKIRVALIVKGQGQG